MKAVFSGSLHEQWSQHHLRHIFRRLGSSTAILHEVKNPEAQLIKQKNNSSYLALLEYWNLKKVSQFNMSYLKITSSNINYEQWNKCKASSRLSFMCVFEEILQWEAKFSSECALLTYSKNVARSKHPINIFMQRNKISGIWHSCGTSLCLLRENVWSNAKLSWILIIKFSTEYNI